MVDCESKIPAKDPLIYFSNRSDMLLASGSSAPSKTLYKSSITGGSLVLCVSGSVVIPLIRYVSIKARSKIASSVGVNAPKISLNNACKDNNFWPSSFSPSTATDDKSNGFIFDGEFDEKLI